MEKYTGQLKKPARRQVTKKKTQTRIEKEEGIEYVINETAKLLTGQTLNEDQMEALIKNCGIDRSRPLSMDDKFVIYNLLSEPALVKQEGESQYEYVMPDESYGEKVKEVSEKMEDILPSNRVIGLYDSLPSLEINRVNFNIEKDIFRNKPLLGKGLFKCKWCKSTNTEDYEQQTRSADEPSTVKVICRDCGKQWKMG
jgi:DNA-directed RNA polymerase subunit M/transcription elongation factor TFIIS